MKQRLKLYFSCALIILLIGCNTKNHNKDTKEQTVTQQIESTSIQETTEQEEKTNLILSEKESISCIAKALDSDENEKYASYILDFLISSGIPVSDIVAASIVGENEYSCRYLLQITDSENRCYVIGLEDHYSIIGIKKDSKDGDWIFTVTQ